ncbi:uncharacterized protein FOMMEDRAFT_161512 [Fomitiporia mediterranea MF3/22]|uniref:uncharacterized protein n=1 Tax=Fomitiporia mediterranea (strain MF3/22) TaxID=694068 RepID=UPI0004408BE5|nr:uncharacterized protein FOMMEDRAFT_161512 [Fomitiporia mediterranea MF3/22]EJC98681.1 hypothetical protein FOMMEDRAFT_161512 [Fomitiporia mediterranea MF3/22]
MPVTADSQHYASYSSTQQSPDYGNTGYNRRADPATIQHYPSEYDKAHEQAGPSHVVEHAQSPKRSPSLFRRISATVKSRSSPSMSTIRQNLPPGGSGNASNVRADPMYAAPSATSTSQSSGLHMNPVSRFRKARNAAKDTSRHERDTKTERVVTTEEWRVYGRTGQSNPSTHPPSSAKGQHTSGRWHDANRQHGRSGSEVQWNQANPRQECPQSNTPLARSNTVGTSMARSRTEMYPREGGYYRKYQYSSSERHETESSAQARPDNHSRTGNPPRMGKYGVYASPSTATTRIPNPSQEIWLPRKDGESADRTARRSPTTRVEGWNVQIAPSTVSSVPLSGQNRHTRGSTQARTLNTDSPSLTFVTDHPLSEGAVPSPPDALEAEKAKEFAMNLAKRMSMLLTADDVDVDSNPDSGVTRPSDGLPTSVDDAQVSSPTTSGTATPTRPVAQDESVHPGNEPENSSTSNADTSSPFGTFLSNAREMNNAFVRGTESMWGKLFGKNRGKEKGEAPEETREESALAAQEASKSDVEESEVEGSRDIMLYSPLIPDADSTVELAASEVVTLYGDGSDDARERAYRDELRRRWADGRGFVSFDALSTIEPVQEESDDSEGTQPKAEQEHSATVDNTPLQPTSDAEQASKQSDRPRPRERVVWVPSRTQISVQVLWWGYRIYLPPPVLHVLSNRTIETAKRAALLTAALTWLLENLPIATLPPVLAPAALLLRALVPLLGMIGAFISWGWKATITFDKGNGVVLSATWLLPIVLVPGTWEDNEVPPTPSGIGAESMAAGPPRQDTRSSNDLAGVSTDQRASTSS